jgi:fatty acid desaturase
MFGASEISPRHRRITWWLIAETTVLYLALAVAAHFLFRADLGGWFWLLYPPVLVMQGLWLDRIYIVGHEGAHKKLFPQNRRANDLTASLVLLPILVPINIYRKIHAFHHGFNRKDHHTSALDVFVSSKPVGPLKRAWYYLLWFWGVFAGGYFLHSLASVIIFLFIPTKSARKISPAFKGWNVRDRLKAWLMFGSGVGLQVGIGLVFGWEVWRTTFLYPLLMFSWIWSLLVYIFHYRTSIGPKVQYNARSLRRNWFFSWLLLNFNEHSTHHMHPTIPWYRLPEKRKPLPDEFASNQNVSTIFQAILQQFQGPIIIEKNEAEKGTS